MNTNLLNQQSALGNLLLKTEKIADFETVGCKLSRKLRANTATFSEGLQTSLAGASYNPQISVPIPSIASEIVE